MSLSPRRHATEPKAVWIVDTSPFVALAKIGHLDLLSAPGREVWITDVVEREVMAGPTADAAQSALRQGWGMRMETTVPPITLTSMHLDAGEASVLTLALRFPNSVAILDDSAGRSAAKRLGVSVVGTVGVLLAARQAGRLLEIAPLLRELNAVGLFLPNESLLIGLLASVGEVWPERS